MTKPKYTDSLHRITASVLEVAFARRSRAIHSYERSEYEDVFSVDFYEERFPQRAKQARKPDEVKRYTGAKGFEPLTSWSGTKCSVR
jgi:hypothetical protein